MKIIYAYVVGDIIHRGHLFHLKNAKSLGDTLIVGVLSEKAVLEKKPKPIFSLSERMQLIRALKMVDLVVVQDEYSPIKNIKIIKPNILAESESHNNKDIKEVIKIMKSIKGKVIVLPYFPEQSSTKIKEKIRNE